MLCLTENTFISFIKLTFFTCIGFLINVSSVILCVYTPHVFFCLLYDVCFCLFNSEFTAQWIVSWMDGLSI